MGGQAVKERIYRLLGRWCSRLPWWPRAIDRLNRDFEIHQVGLRAGFRDGERRCREVFLNYLRVGIDFPGTPHEAVLAARGRDKARIAALEARVEELEGVLLDAQAAAVAGGRPVVGSARG